MEIDFYHLLHRSLHNCMRKLKESFVATSKRSKALSKVLCSAMIVPCWKPIKWFLYFRVVFTFQLAQKDVIPTCLYTTH